jgi:hypothetical protein
MTNDNTRRTALNPAKKYCPLLTYVIHWIPKAAVVVRNIKIAGTRV